MKKYEREIERRLQRVRENYVRTAMEVYELRLKKAVRIYCEDFILGIDHSEFEHGLSMGWPEPKQWKLAIPEVVNLVAGGSHENVA